MLKEADIEPVVVMFHHDLPLALETEYSGFLRLDFLMQFDSFYYGIIKIF